MPDLLILDEPLAGLGKKMAPLPLFHYTPFFPEIFYFSFIIHVGCPN